MPSSKTIINDMGVKEAYESTYSSLLNWTLDLILKSVKGNLRLCANLCYRSLLEACRINERVVDHTHVNSVLIQPHWRTHDDLITGEVVA